MHEMNADLIPRPLGRMLSLLPAYPGSLLFSQVLNLALSDLLPNDMRQMLRNKTVCIAVTDAQLAFHFVWDGRRFTGCSASAAPDLKISAGAQDFYRLATRKEDADTLFFNRRLLMEGDTELGLAVKNLLDSIETPLLRPESLAPAELSNLIRARVARKHGGPCAANP